MSAPDGLRPGHVLEEWICTGRRLNTSGKIVYGWVNPAGRHMNFGKVKGQPARRYTIDAEYVDAPDASPDEQEVIVYGEPVWVGPLPVDDDRRLEWEAADRVTMARHEVLRMAAADAKDSAVSALVAPLRDQYRKQVGPARRAAFLALVIEMVTR